MDTTVKRKIIKNTAVIFFSVLLVLTFFSSTIRNRSLPEVATQYVESGQITNAVRGTGMAQANEIYKVVLPEKRTIHSVAVRNGDNVKEGDLLFVLEAYESKELEDARDALSRAEREYQKWQLQAQGELDDLNLQIQYETEDLETLRANGNAGGDVSYEDIVTAKERTLAQLKTKLERARILYELEEPTYTEAVSRAKADLDRISETVVANEIYAAISGTVNNIYISAGQTADAQTVLAEIEQQDRGCSVELSMTAEQANRISVGQTAKVLNYWGLAPEAVVKSIRPSHADPQYTRIVTLSLQGNVTSGQSFTFSLGERSTDYDYVVPSSAIREDSNGKFVLVVEAKNTPIGNRYTAIRCGVQVLAEDDINTAVTGLNGGEFIIITAATPISAGQQVRLSDS